MYSVLDRCFHVGSLDSTNHFMGRVVGGFGIV